MKTVKGIYAEAKIFTDDVEDYAEAQVKMICDNEVAEGSIIRLMPDIHPGKVGPIGLSMTVTDKIIPQLLGVDIGCGMTCVKLKKANIEFQKLDKVIREKIPSGFSVRKEPHHMAEEFSYEGLHCLGHINRERADRSLGTLGGGNHFIELDKGTDGIKAAFLKTLCLRYYFQIPIFLFQCFEQFCDRQLAFGWSLTRADLNNHTLFSPIWGFLP